MYIQSDLEESINFQHKVLTSSKQYQKAIRRKYRENKYVNYRMYMK